jgi:hypothetical protein
MGDDSSGGYTVDDPGPSADSADYGQQFYADGDSSPATIPVAPPNDVGYSDAWNATAWDVGGALPFVGTPVSVLSTAIDLGEAGISALEGDEAATGRHLSDASLDAIGIIPIVGNVVSGVEAVHDGIATHERGEGASNEDAPTVGDVWGADSAIPPTYVPNEGGDGAPPTYDGGAGGGSG